MAWAFGYSIRTGYAKHLEMGINKSTAFFYVRI